MATKLPRPSVRLHVIGRRDALRVLTAGVAVAACGEPSTVRDAAVADADGAVGHEDASDVQLADAHDAQTTDASDVQLTDASDVQTADTGPCIPLSLALGPVANYPMGTWVLNRDDLNNPVVVGHDAGGYFVFTAICPHDFCEVGVPAADGQTLCGCHVSYFDGNGARISGPSPGPLVHFAAAVCNGMLSADPNVVVAPETRTPG